MKTRQLVDETFFFISGIQESELLWRREKRSLKKTEKKSGIYYGCPQLKCYTIWVFQKFTKTYKNFCIDSIDIKPWDSDLTREKRASRICSARRRPRTRISVVRARRRGFRTFDYKNDNFICTIVFRMIFPYDRRSSYPYVKSFYPTIPRNHISKDLSGSRFSQS